MTKKVAIYPGTFDPITNGHIDLIERAADIFDEVIVAISDNPKKNPLFKVEERQHLIEQTTDHLTNIRTVTFDDLLINLVKRENSRFIIRGLRAVSDFDYEFQLASANRRLDDTVETIFLTPSESNYFISSSLVREISRYKGDVSSFVTPVVEQALKKKQA